MKQQNTLCSFCRKSHREVGPLVEGPGDVYICGECVELCQSIIEQEKRRRNRSQGLPFALPNSPIIRERLDLLIAGQDEAKRALSVAVHDHYERCGYGHPGQVTAPRERSCILLIGPARSSKIFLARTLAHIMEVPFAHGDANALVASDSINHGLAPLLAKLLESSDFDIDASQRGMVYLDGVDQPDLQQHLLAELEEKAPRALPHGLQVDTAGMLFLAGGVFPGLGEVMARQGRHSEQPVTGSDLIAFGVIPALVQRIQRIVALAPLDEETLVRIVS